MLTDTACAAAGRKLLAGQRSLLQALNASEHAVVVSLQVSSSYSDAKEAPMLNLATRQPAIRALLGS